MIETITSPLRAVWESLLERLFFLPPFPEAIDSLALFGLLLVVGLLIGEGMPVHFNWLKAGEAEVAHKVPPLEIDRRLARPLRPLADFLANATQNGGRVLLCAESAGRLQTLQEVRKRGFHLAFKENILDGTCSKQHLEKESYLK